MILTRGSKRILWNRATIFRRLCLSRHCDEGEQDGDDGFLHKECLICSFQSYYLIYTLRAAELKQRFLVFTLHQHVSTNILYRDSIYFYQVIACTDTFLISY